MWALRGHGLIFLNEHIFHLLNWGIFSFRILINFSPRGFLFPYHSNIKSLILNLRRLIPVFLILVILKSLANAQCCARIELGPDISFGKSVPDRGDENWPQRGDLSPAVFGLCLVCPTFLVVSWICDLTRWCKCAALGMKGVLIHVAL